MSGAPNLGPCPIPHTVHFATGGQASEDMQGEALPLSLMSLELEISECYQTFGDNNVRTIQSSQPP